MLIKKILLILFYNVIICNLVLPHSLYAIALSPNDFQIDSNLLAIGASQQGSTQPIDVFDIPVQDIMPNETNEFIPTYLPDISIDNFNIALDRVYSAVSEQLNNPETSNLLSRNWETVQPAVSNFIWRDILLNDDNWDTQDWNLFDQGIMNSVLVRAATWQALKAKGIKDDNFDQDDLEEVISSAVNILKGADENVLINEYIIHETLEIMGAEYRERMASILSLEGDLLNRRMDLTDPFDVLLLESFDSSDVEELNTKLTALARDDAFKSVLTDAIEGSNLSEVEKSLLREGVLIPDLPGDVAFSEFLANSQYDTLLKYAMLRSVGGDLSSEDISDILDNTGGDTAEIRLNIENVLIAGEMYGRSEFQSLSVDDFITNLDIEGIAGVFMDNLANGVLIDLPRSSDLSYEIAVIKYLLGIEGENHQSIKDSFGQKLENNNINVITVDNKEAVCTLLVESLIETVMSRFNKLNQLESSITNKIETDRIGLDGISAEGYLVEQETTIGKFELSLPASAVPNLLKIAYENKSGQDLNIQLSIDSIKYVLTNGEEVDISMYFDSDTNIQFSSNDRWVVRELAVQNTAGFEQFLRDNPNGKILIEVSNQGENPLPENELFAELYFAKDIISPDKLTEIPLNLNGEYLANEFKDILTSRFSDYVLPALKLTVGDLVANALQGKLGISQIDSILTYSLGQMMLDGGEGFDDAKSAVSEAIDLYSKQTALELGYKDYDRLDSISVDRVSLNLYLNGDGVTEQEQQIAKRILLEGFLGRDLEPRSYKDLMTLEYFQSLSLEQLNGIISTAEVVKPTTMEERRNFYDWLTQSFTTQGVTPPGSWERIQAVSNISLDRIIDWILPQEFMADILLDTLWDFGSINLIEPREGPFTRYFTDYLPATDATIEETINFILQKNKIGPYSEAAVLAREDRGAAVTTAGRLSNPVESIDNPYDVTQVEQFMLLHPELKYLMEELVGPPQYDYESYYGGDLSERNILLTDIRSMVQYFLDTQDFKTGIFKDAVGSVDNSNGVAGFGLNALVIGHQIGMLSDEEFFKRVNLVIDYYTDDPNDPNDMAAEEWYGIFYHYFRGGDDVHAGSCETSVIDGAGLLHMGLAGLSSYLQQLGEEVEGEAPPSFNWHVAADNADQIMAEMDYAAMQVITEEGLNSGPYPIESINFGATPQLLGITNGLIDAYFEYVATAIMAIGTDGEASAVSWKMFYKQLKDNDFRDSYTGDSYLKTPDNDPFQYEYPWLQIDSRFLCLEEGGLGGGSQNARDREWINSDFYINFYRNSMINKEDTFWTLMRNSQIFRNLGYHTWWASSMALPEYYNMDFTLGSNGMRYEGTITPSEFSASLAMGSGRAIDAYKYAITAYDPILRGYHWFFDSINTERSFVAPTEFGLGMGIALVGAWNSLTDGKRTIEIDGEDITVNSVWDLIGNNKDTLRGMMAVGFREDVSPYYDDSETIITDVDAYRAFGEVSGDVILGSDGFQEYIDATIVAIDVLGDSRQDNSQLLLNAVDTAIYNAKTIADYNLIAIAIRGDLSGSTDSGKMLLKSVTAVSGEDRTIYDPDDNLSVELFARLKEVRILQNQLAVKNEIDNRFEEVGISIDELPENLSFDEAVACVDVMEYVRDIMHMPDERALGAYQYFIDNNDAIYNAAEAAFITAMNDTGSLDQDKVLAEAYLFIVLKREGLSYENKINEDGAIEYGYRDVFISLAEKGLTDDIKKTFIDYFGEELLISAYSLAQELTSEVGNIVSREDLEGYARGDKFIADITGVSDYLDFLLQKASSGNPLDDEEYISLNRFSVIADREYIQNQNRDINLFVASQSGKLGYFIAKSILGVAPEDVAGKIAEVREDLINMLKWKEPVENILGRDLDLWNSDEDIQILSFVTTLINEGCSESDIIDSIFDSVEDVLAPEEITTRREAAETALNNAGNIAEDDEDYMRIVIESEQQLHYLGLDDGVVAGAVNSVLPDELTSYEEILTQWTELATDLLSVETINTNLLLRTVDLLPQIEMVRTKVDTDNPDDENGWFNNGDWIVGRIMQGFVFRFRGTGRFLETEDPQNRALARELQEMMHLRDVLIDNVFSAEYSGYIGGLTDADKKVMADQMGVSVEMLDDDFYKSQFFASDSNLRLGLALWTGLLQKKGIFNPRDDFHNNYAEMTNTLNRLFTPSLADLILQAGADSGEVFALLPSYLGGLDKDEILLDVIPNVASESVRLDSQETGSFVINMTERENRNIDDFVLNVVYHDPTRSNLDINLTNISAQCVIGDVTFDLIIETSGDSTQGIVFVGDEWKVANLEIENKEEFKKFLNENKQEGTITIEIKNAGDNVLPPSKTNDKLYTEIIINGQSVSDEYTPKSETITKGLIGEVGDLGSEFERLKSGLSDSWQNVVQFATLEEGEVLSIEQLARFINEVNIINDLKSQFSDGGQLRFEAGSPSPVIKFLEQYVLGLPFEGEENESLYANEYREWVGLRLPEAQECMHTIFDFSDQSKWDYFHRLMRSMYVEDIEGNVTQTEVFRLPTAVDITLIRKDKFVELLKELHGVDVLENYIWQGDSEGRGLSRENVVFESLLAYYADQPDIVKTMLDLGFNQVLVRRSEDQSWGSLETLYLGEDDQFDLLGNDNHKGVTGYYTSEAKRLGGIGVIDLLLSEMLAKGLISQEVLSGLSFEDALKNNNAELIIGELKENFGLEDDMANNLGNGIYNMLNDSYQSLVTMATNTDLTEDKIRTLAVDSLISVIENAWSISNSLNNGFDESGLMTFFSERFGWGDEAAYVLAREILESDYSQEEISAYIGTIAAGIDAVKDNIRVLTAVRNIYEKCTGSDLDLEKLKSVWALSAAANEIFLMAKGDRDVFLTKVEQVFSSSDQISLDSLREDYEFVGRLLEFGAGYKLLTKLLNLTPDISDPLIAGTISYMAEHWIEGLDIEDSELNIEELIEYFGLDIEYLQYSQDKESKLGRGLIDSIEDAILGDLTNPESELALFLGITSREELEENPIFVGFAQTLVHDVWRGVFDQREVTGFDLDKAVNEALASIKSRISALDGLLVTGNEAEGVEDKGLFTIEQILTSAGVEVQEASLEDVLQSADAMGILSFYAGLMADIPQSDIDEITNNFESILTVIEALKRDGRLSIEVPESQEDKEAFAKMLSYYLKYNSKKISNPVLENDFETILLGYEAFYEHRDHSFEEVSKWYDSEAIEVIQLIDDIHSTYKFWNMVNSLSAGSSIEEAWNDFVTLAVGASQMLDPFAAALFGQANILRGKVDQAGFLSHQAESVLKIALSKYLEFQEGGEEAVQNFIRMQPEYVELFNSYLEGEGYETRIVNGRIYIKPTEKVRMEWGTYTTTETQRQGISAVAAKGKWMQWMDSIGADWMSPTEGQLAEYDVFASQTTDVEVEIEREGWLAVTYLEEHPIYPIRKEFEQQYADELAGLFDKTPLELALEYGARIVAENLLIAYELKPLVENARFIEIDVANPDKSGILFYYVSEAIKLGIDKVKSILEKEGEAMSILDEGGYSIDPNVGPVWLMGWFASENIFSSDLLKEAGKVMRRGDAGITRDYSNTSFVIRSEVDPKKLAELGRLLEGIGAFSATVQRETVVSPTGTETDAVVVAGQTVPAADTDTVLDPDKVEELRRWIEQYSPSTEDEVQSGSVEEPGPSVADEDPTGDAAVPDVTVGPVQDPAATVQAVDSVVEPQLSVPQITDAEILLAQLWGLEGEQLSATADFFENYAQRWVSRTFSDYFTFRSQYQPFVEKAVAGIISRIAALTGDDFNFWVERDPEVDYARYITMYPEADGKYSDLMNRFVDYFKYEFEKVLEEQYDAQDEELRRGSNEFREFERNFDATLDDVLDRTVNRHGLWTYKGTTDRAAGRISEYMKFSAAITDIISTLEVQAPMLPEPIVTIVDTEVGTTVQDTAAGTDIVLDPDKAEELRRLIEQSPPQEGSKVVEAPVQDAAAVTLAVEVETPVQDAAVITSAVKVETPVQDAAVANPPAVEVETPTQDAAEKPVARVRIASTQTNGARYNIRAYRDNNDNNEFEADEVFQSETAYTSSEEAPYSLELPDEGDYRVSVQTTLPDYRDSEWVNVDFSYQENDVAARSAASVSVPTVNPNVSGNSLPVEVVYSDINSLVVAKIPDATVGTIGFWDSVRLSLADSLNRINSVLTDDEVTLQSLQATAIIIDALKEITLLPQMINVESEFESELFVTDYISDYSGQHNFGQDFLREFVNTVLLNYSLLGWNKSIEVAMPESIKWSLEQNSLYGNTFREEAELLGEEYGYRGWGE
ncbi:MAG: hypothetical protein P9M06_04565 [Candidatus Saelkia tenebricola]|nr:hypothetical protein [Candidatus Saelkia tenebricola]